MSRPAMRTRNEPVGGTSPHHRGARQGVSGRPRRGRDVRRTPGDLGGAHVLHPHRGGWLVCVAAGIAMRIAAEGSTGGWLADRDGTVAADPGLSRGVPALPR
ncbi:integrase family domain protein [Mycobacterium xenopi 3993]|nr:integrase family domain protein [Mycobacterium xenopi 3993]